MPDVFEVLGAAHREVEQMLDRMQAMMSVPAELRDQGGALPDTLISAVSQHEAAEEEYFWPTVKEKVADGDSLAVGGSSGRPKASRRSRRAGRDGPDDQQFVPLITKFAHAARAHTRGSPICCGSLRVLPASVRPAALRLEMEVADGSRA
jgi:hypothetical protein